MISVEEINKAILDLENHDTTFATCEKLSWLYIVRDHIAGDVKSNERSGQYQGSEFLSVSSNVNVADLLRILDEHMDVVKILMPREYDALMGKIRGLM